MPLLQVCKITIPGTGSGAASTYHFQAAKSMYKGDISAQTGVVEADATFNNDEPLIKIEQLILSGKLMKLWAECVNGSKKKLVGVYVRRDKVEEVLSQPSGSLEGKTLASFGTIKTVRSKNSDTFS